MGCKNILRLSQILQRSYKNKSVMMIFQLVDTGRHNRKNFRPKRSRIYDLPVSSLDALSLSYRSLVGAWPLNLFHVAWDQAPKWGIGRKVKAEKKIGEAERGLFGTRSARFARHCFNPVPAKQSLFI